MNSSEERKPLVFISHAAAKDKDIAAAFQKWLLLAYAHKVDVFVSSTDGIKPNSIPAKEIQDAIDRAVVFLILHTSNSAGKHWITYESGCANGGKKVALHILCKGAKADRVASPITTMSELLDTADERQFFEIIKTLNASLHLENEESFEDLRHTLSRKKGSKSITLANDFKSNASPSISGSELSEIEKEWRNNDVHLTPFERQLVKRGAK